MRELAPQIENARRLKLGYIIFTHPYPKTLKRDINQFKFEYMPSWRNAFNMYPDLENGTLTLKFRNFSIPVTVPFSGDTVEGELDKKGIATRVLLSDGKKQLRFKVVQLTDHDIKVLYQLSDEYIVQHDDTYIVFTPLKAAQDASATSRITESNTEQESDDNDADDDPFGF